MILDKNTIHLFLDKKNKFSKFKTSSIENNKKKPGLPKKELNSAYLFCW